MPGLLGAARKLCRLRHDPEGADPRDPGSRDCYQRESKGTTDILEQLIRKT